MSSPIRFSGLASGMDTESIIKKMMEPYQLKLDNMQKEKKLLEMKQEVWKDVNKKVYDFWKKELGDLRLTSTMLQRKAVSSDSDKISVTKVNSKASKGNHEIKITQLAKSAMLVSGSNRDNEAKIEVDGRITVSYQGEDINVDLRAGDSMKLAVGKINGAIADKNGKVKAVYDEGAKRIFITANECEESAEISLSGDIGVLSDLGFKKQNLVSTSDAAAKISEDGEVAIKIGDDLISVTLNKDDDKQDVVDKINAAAGSKITAVNNSGVITINKNNPADTVTLHGTLWNDIGLGGTEDNVSKQGKIAKYEYDGISLESDSNEVTVGGIKMEFKSVTADEVNISVTNDTEKVYEKVKSFVTKYNELITDLNERYGAKRNKDYKPLLAEEKKAMSEDEIKLWNEKINKSILRRDGVIKGILTSMRDTLGRDANAIKADGAPNIDDDYNYLFKMGIVTGDWKEKGLLHIQGDEDEDAEYSEKTNKLKELIEKDPEKLIEALSTFGKNIYSDIQEKMGKTKYSSAFTLYNDVTLKEDIEDYEDKYKALQKKVLAVENRYYKQFAQMEKIIQNSNTQGQYLQSQIAGM